MPGRIDIHDLRVARGEFTLEVDELSINEGEIFAILGTTGSGKTVLMESVAGAFPINGGSILLDGKDIDSLPIQQRHLGILYQDYALFPHMTVHDNIAYGLKRKRPRPHDIDEQVNEMLQLFGIEHLADRFPGVISGGESQRTALARALVMRPEILILDEPFSALDPTTKKQMYGLLRCVHERFGCTIVFVTHDFNEAQTLADRVGVILDGKLRCVVEAARLFDDEHAPEVKRFLGLE
jgi:molybdate transport system ATP-binding protein